MFFLLRNITLLCLLCIVISGSSQNTTFSKSETGIAEFIFIDDPDRTDQYTNHFISTLADGNKMSVRDISYKFYYTVVSRLLQKTDSVMSGMISFKGFIISGNIKYRGFSLSEELIPSKANAKVKLLNKVNKQTTTFQLDNIPVTSSKTSADFMVSDSSLLDNLNLETTIKYFFYEEGAKTIFDKKIAAINAYYLYDSILSNAEIKIKKIDPAEVDRIPLFNIWIDELNDLITEMTNKDYQDDLKLESYDPISFISRTNKLSEQIKILQSKLKNDLGQMDVIYYERAVDFLKKYNYEEAEVYLDKTLQFNTLYFPAHLMKAKMHLRKGEPGESVEIIKFIDEKIEISQAERNILSELGDDVVKYYLTAAEELIMQDNNNEALDAIVKAEGFCNTIPGIDCPQQIFEIKSKAKYGIFKSYLQIATKAMAIVNYDFAEDYIQKASEYHRNNSEFINSEDEISDLYGKLISRCTDKGYEALALPDFNMAQNYFDRAYRLCNYLNEFSCSQRLIDGINNANHGIALEYDDRTDEENKSSTETGSKPEKIEEDRTAAPPPEYKIKDYNRLIAEGEILFEANYYIDAFHR